jgi:hypothetical protein
MSENKQQLEIDGNRTTGKDVREQNGINSFFYF